MIVDNSYNFYDNLPYKAYVIDLHTNDVVFINNKMRKTINNDRKCLDIIYSIDKKCSFCNINKKNYFDNIEDERVYDVYCEICNKWYQITETIENKGDKVYKHSIAIDITEYKNKDMQKEQLLQESRLSAMSEMIDMLSHQWRQPLTAININAQSIKFKSHMNKLSTENVDMLTDSIVKVVKELSDTIADFNYIFKASTKKYDVVVNEPIQKVIELNNELLKETGINLILNLESTKILNIFKKDLIQVILRIFTNAIEAFDKEKNIKTITIKSFDTEKTTQIDIIDNGKGITDEVLPKIYEPYFSTKSYNKKGLGLYFAKVLANDHLNAEIVVSNKNDTKFSIIINH